MYFGMSVSDGCIEQLVSFGRCHTTVTELSYSFRECLRVGIQLYDETNAEKKVTKDCSYRDYAAECGS